MKWLYLLVVLLAAQVAQANPVTPSDWVSFANYGDGTHYIKIVVVDGKLTAVMPFSVTVLPAPGEDPVIPDEPEDPEEPSDPLVKAVSTLVAKAPKTTKERKAISKLFETTANLPLSDPKQIQQATTTLFTALSLSAEWKQWKTDVDSFADSLDVDDVKKAWQLIAGGLK